MHIGTACSAPSNLSSGEKIAEQGADRIRELAQQDHLEQKTLNSASVGLESAQSVPQTAEVSEGMINTRVNQYQQMAVNKFTIEPKDNLGNLININV